MSTVTSLTPCLLHCTHASCRCRRFFRLENAADHDVRMPAVGLGTGGYGQDAAHPYAYPECWSDGTPGPYGSVHSDCSAPVIKVSAASTPPPPCKGRRSNVTFVSICWQCHKRKSRPKGTRSCSLRQRFSSLTTPLGSNKASQHSDTCLCVVLTKCCTVKTSHTPPRRHNLLCLPRAPRCV